MLTLAGETLLDRACRIVRPHVQVLAIIGETASTRVGIISGGGAGFQPARAGSPPHPWMPEGTPYLDAHPSTRSLAEVLLSDVPGVRGPIAGILAALEYEPRADWLVLGCDMPAVESAAIDWLLARRHSELAEHAAAAIVARLPDRDHLEPLLAIYTPSATDGLRAAVASGNSAMHAAFGMMPCSVQVPPAHLANCWLNVNTPRQWQDFLAGRQPPP